MKITLATFFSVAVASSSIISNDNSCALAFLTSTTRSTTHHASSSPTTTRKTTTFIRPPPIPLHQHQSTTKKGSTTTTSGNRKIIIEGAAKDAEEDLKLTLQIIMDFAERQAAKEAEEGKVGEEEEEEMEEEEKSSLEEEEGDEDEKEVESKKKTEPSSKEQKEDEKAATKSPPVTKGFVIPSAKTATIPKERKSNKARSLSSNDASSSPPKPLASKKGLYSPDQFPTDVEIQREFRFVDDAETTFKITDGKPSISCDSRIPSVEADLELSQLDDNQTPEELYADTTTEMALKLAQRPQYTQDLKDAWILNNHYDTSGLLAVYACLEPTMALKYSELLIAAAEAGEFGEWSTEEGVKLDLSLQELRSRQNGEGISFLLVLTGQLPGLLQDFYETGGQKHEELWRERYAKVMKSWESFQSNQAVVSAYSDDMVIVERSWNVPPVSPYALHRKLKEMGIELTTKRVLHVLRDVTGARYKYEMIGHGHIRKLVERPTLKVVDAKQLVDDLNAEYDGTGNWQTAAVNSEDGRGGGGSSNGDVTMICQALDITTIPVEDVADYLLEHDNGL